MKTKTEYICGLFTWAVLVILPIGLVFPRSQASAYYLQVNLTSDVPGAAVNTDPYLINPWGISHSSTSPFWVSDNGTGVSTLYNSGGQPFPIGSPLVVSIPPSAGGTSPSTPTGQVFNGSASFEISPGAPARFLFATEDGTISGWNPSVAPTNALLEVDNSSAGAIYTGLAIGNNGSGDFLYAANFYSGAIDVFDSHFSLTTLGGRFTDPNLPSGYAPFNVQNLGASLFVTYALKDSNTGDVESGPGYGLVDVFDLNGNFVRRLSSGGVLNAPWGLALAPANFGEFSSSFLVGNFGDGLINAFNPSTGAFLGYLQDSIGDPIAIDGLRGLIFGNGGNGGDPNVLYFTAATGGEMHGLFGSLAVIPEPATILLLGTGLAGLGAFRIRKRKK